MKHSLLQPGGVAKLGPLRAGFADDVEFMPPGLHDRLFAAASAR
jgi:hypothetical protein